MKIALFVCVHNAGRSQMAEAFVNHLASTRGLAIRGESAGTEGGKSLNPVAVQVMDELGISMVGQAPKLLTQQMVDRASRVVTMGCGVDADRCPARIHLSEDWGLDDPAGRPMDEVRAIRDLIQSNVEVLIEEMLNGD